MKICVYAICKNEEKFIDRWYNSVKDADEIFSYDHTIYDLLSLYYYKNKS